MILKYNLKKGINFSERVYFGSFSKKIHTFLKKGKKIILDGKFYYDSDGFSKEILLDNNVAKKLLALVKKYDIENFINNVEGEFLGVEIDHRKETVKIFSDKLKQKEVYYFYKNDVFFASDNLTEIIDNVGVPGYEKNSFISAILLYPPKGQTIFKGINRLRHNETIKIVGNRISIEKSKDKNIEISDYTEKDLLRYEKLYTNAVLSRASRKLNLVFTSGGWDSTMLLAVLAKNLGKKKVRGVIVKVVMSDGRCFNEYEVEKSLKIGKILGVKIDVVEIDYREKETVDIAKTVLEDPWMNKMFLLFLAPANWMCMVKHIKKKYGKETVVFNGNGSDSLHNFGFSQYISLPGQDDNFLEYGDKMKNYLFSPTFFERLKNNKFLSDSVYKIFRFFNQDKEFADVKNLNREDKIYYYLLSFIYSDIRVPFRKIDYKRFVKDSAFTAFNKWLRKEYFEDAVKNINKNNLYYYFSSLYASFHLQGPPIQIYRSGLENVRFPFLDSHLFRFLYKMPQSFGRGLEWKPIKYPLKLLAEKIFPPELMKVIKSGPHSYLSEIEDINIYNEYFLKGPVYDYMRRKINFEKCRDVFDNSIFVTSEMEKFVRNFREGKIKNISFSDGRFLIILLLLSARENI